MRASVIVMVFAAGCYDPLILDGDFICGPAPDRICPSGFTCGGNNHCFRDPSQLDFTIAPFRGNGELRDVDLTGMTADLTFDTKTGVVTVGTSTIADGKTGFKLLAQTDGPPVAVWSFANLTIPSGMKVTAAINNHAIPVIAATDRLVMNGAIKCVGFGGAGGGPNLVGKNRDTAFTTGGTPGSTGGGGGGGGYGSAGSPGSAGGGMGGTGGGTFGNPEVTPLQVGAGGAGGGGVMAGIGGNGGGSFALFAKRVELAGSIDCSGEDGRLAAQSMAGGGGGGSGGSILISADSIQLMAAHQLKATGGKGAPAAVPGAAGGGGGDGRIWIGSMEAPAGTFNALPKETKVTGGLGVVTQFPR
jgi:hypothetical protein